MLMRSGRAFVDPIARRPKAKSSVSMATSKTVSSRHWRPRVSMLRRALAAEVTSYPFCELGRDTLSAFLDLKD